MTTAITLVEESEPRTDDVTTTRLERSAEVSCLMCGRSQGRLVRIDLGPLVLHPPGGMPPQVLEHPGGLRCGSCRGNVVLGDVISRKIRVEDPRKFFDTPRRGRPPKWLVAQRLREAALGSSALAS